MVAIFLLFIYFVFVDCDLTSIKSYSSSLPNFVFIVADDLGWDDVSHHGSNQVLTPNIDLLAYTGVALERYYSHCVCTPSRTALLTGKYAHTTGMHGYPLTNAEDRGLPTSEKILPQYLKEMGYATHLVGKWHIGHSRTEYMPTSRGFDTYFGHTGGYIDYYEYTSEETWTIGKVSGFNLYRNLSAAWEVEGYITDVYTQEAKKIIQSHDISSPLFLMVSHNAPHSANNGALLQASPETVRAMRYIESPERRIYAAMVQKLDDSVGDIVESLLEKQMLNNTIIVFVSDNGGVPTGRFINYGSNWPLRGQKFSPFEGGIRVTGLLWSPLINMQNNVWKGYMHAVDWLPTVLKAVGQTLPSDIDGIDLWHSIINNEDSARDEIFEIYDNNHTMFRSIIKGNFKLVVGSIEYTDYGAGDLRGFIGDGPLYSNIIESSKVFSILPKIGKEFATEMLRLRDDVKIKCKETGEDSCIPTETKACLYNIKEDPCELHDLSAVHSDIVKQLLARLQTESKRIKDRVWPLYRDPRGLPRLHNYTWSIWADDLMKT